MFCFQTRWLWWHDAFPTGARLTTWGSPRTRRNILELRRGFCWWGVGPCGYISWNRNAIRSDVSSSPTLNQHWMLIHPLWRSSVLCVANVAVPCTWGPRGQSSPFWPRGQNRGGTWQPQGVGQKKCEQRCSCVCGAMGDELESTLLLPGSCGKWCFSKGCLHTPERFSGILGGKNARTFDGGMYGFFSWYVAASQFLEALWKDSSYTCSFWWWTSWTHMEEHLLSCPSWGWGARVEKGQHVCGDDGVLHWYWYYFQHKNEQRGSSLWNMRGWWTNSEKDSRFNQYWKWFFNQTWPCRFPSYTSQTTFFPYKVCAERSSQQPVQGFRCVG